MPTPALVVWHDIDWKLYLQLDKKLEGSSTRLTYCQGRLDIMTLSNDHERIKNTLHDLIVAHCFDAGIEFTSEGSATRRITGDRGKEPDDSFIFGDKPKARPDLLLEVALTSGGIDKLEFYAPFKIPEIWIWTREGLAVFRLAGAGYRKARKSHLLTGFDVTLAGELATWPTTSKAVKEYRRLKSS